MSRRRSFTVAREPIELELGGDLFTAPAVIPPAVLGELLDAGTRIEETQKTAGLSQRDQLDQMMKILDEVLGLVLVPDSVPLFHERLFSRTNPFDLVNELIPAVEWLVQEYSDRPTVPSQPSSTGPGGGTPSSTSGASGEASTPNTSPPTDSATPSTPPSTT